MALTSKLTNIANAIRSKTGKTDKLTLDQMPAEIEAISGGGGYVTEENEYGETVIIGEGGSGDLPKLFEPVVTYPKLNQIAWKRNTKNGDFGDYVVATLDGAEVQSPYDFTEEDDGKTIVITAKCDGFADKKIEISVEYIIPSKELKFTRNIATSSQMPRLTTFYGDGASGFGGRIEFGRDSETLVFDLTDYIANRYVYYGVIARVTCQTGYTTTVAVTCNSITKVKTKSSSGELDFVFSEFDLTGNELFSDVGYIVEATVT